MPGSITLYIGPTKAGKTTELLRLYYCHFTKEDDITIVLHDSVANDSFTKETMKIIQSDSIGNLVMNPLFQKSNVVLIDNLQLFADCFILNILANKMEKKFICAALDNDYQRVPYENIIDIIPKCEYVYKLTALCSQLRDTTPAIFSMKSGDKYLPVSRQYQSIDKKILSVNYYNDRRYDAIGNICSHNQEVFQTMLSISDLRELLSHHNIEDFDVIMIDEVQFLKNALQTIKVLVEEMGKIVITSGLDGDYLQQPFGDVCQLIAFADKFTKLNAVCKLTKEDASFSKRIIASQSKEFIGADEAYVAASRYSLTC